MRCEMPHPCIGSTTRVLRIKRSSVPCRRSSFVLRSAFCVLRSAFCVHPPDGFALASLRRENRAPHTDQLAPTPALLTLLAIAANRQPNAAFIPFALLTQRPRNRASGELSA